MRWERGDFQVKEFKFSKQTSYNKGVLDIDKEEMKDPKSITMKNGRPATQGTCPSCGTKMFRIGKS